MRYMVYFIVPDHDCDGSSRNEPQEQTIVEAESSQEAGQRFYQDSDMSGAYIKEIQALTY